jgi:hypothetical protein
VQIWYVSLSPLGVDGSSLLCFANGSAVLGVCILKCCFSPF